MSPSLASLDRDVDVVRERVARLEVSDQHRADIDVDIKGVLVRLEERLRRLELRVAVIAAVAGGGGAGVGEALFTWLGA